MIGNDAKVILSTFFEKLKGSSSSTLVLDYDGTLAPFHVDRFAAVPYPGVASAVRAILAAERTRVILVSGRPAEEVRDLLGIVPAPEIWGLHGGQRLYPDGRSELLPMKDADREVLRQATDWLRSENLDSLAEFKTGSVAVHWRGLSPEKIEALNNRVRPAFTAMAERSSLALLQFDGGLELRPTEPNKGTAVRAILSEVAEGSPVAFLGDDTTDEDAFRALRGTGALTALVRTEFRATDAVLWLRPPEELLEFFRSWLDRVGGGQ